MASNLLTKYVYSTDSKATLLCLSPRRSAYEDKEVRLTGYIYIRSIEVLIIMNSLQHTDASDSLTETDQVNSVDKISCCSWLVSVYSV